MKQLLVLFALIAVGSSSVWNGGLRVKFGVGTNFGESFFFELPLTASDAVAEGWTTQNQPDGLPVTSVTMYCYPDLVVCNFYDDDGEVAGLQLAISKDNFTPYYDMARAGFTDWTVNGVSFWTIQQFFTTEEILSARNQRANENKIIENGGIWLVGNDKEVLYLANSTSAIENEGIFTRQACTPWMGRHYYYKMEKSLSCNEPLLYPWFILVDSGELIGTGFTVPGKLNLPSGQRSWYETPDVAITQSIITEAPDCLFDLIRDHGYLSLHIYYIDQPWLVSCTFD